MVASPLCGALGQPISLIRPPYARAVNLPLPPDDTTTYAAAFLIGVGAMWISDLLFEWIACRFKPAEDT